MMCLDSMIHPHRVDVEPINYDNGLFESVLQKGCVWGREHNDWTKVDLITIKYLSDGSQ